MLASWSYSYAPLMPGFGRPQEHVALLLLLVMSLLLGACSAPRRAPPAEDVAVQRYAERAYQPEVRHGFDTLAESWPSGDPAAPASVPVSLLVPRGSGMHPLIVYLPGLGEPADAGKQWRSAWAEAGYAVLALQLPRFAQMPGRYAKDADYTALARENYATAALNERLRAVGSVLFELKKRVDRREAPYDRIDTAQLVFAGYDLGAQTVQALAGEKVPGVVLPALPQTPRAAIVISPYASAGAGLARRFSDVHLPVLLATASEDSDSFGVVTALSVRTAPYTYMPAGDKYLLLLAGGSHRALSGDARRGGGPDDAADAPRADAGGRSRGGPGGGMPPGGGQGGPDSGMGGGMGGSMGSGRGGPGGGMGGGAGERPGSAGMSRQASADNPRHAVAVQRVSVAFLDAILRRDALAGEWLERDAERWLGDLGELRHK